MKIRILTGTLCIMLIAIFTAIAFAGTGLPQHNPHFQGIVMENSGTYLIVSERKVLIKTGTYVMNSKKDNIKLSDIKVGSHVFVKGEFDDENNIVAEKIYLLPRHITNKELDQFPFMKGKED